MARNSFIETPNTSQVVTTDEAKTHLRVDWSDDDTYIASLVMSAQQVVEDFCNIILLETTCKQFGDTWDDIGMLYHSPVQNSGAAGLTSIKYYDSDNTLQTWATTEYDFDKYSCPARIALAYNKTFPSIASRLNAIEVTYTIGYASVADVPQALKQAVLILVGQWYENRQEAVIGRSVGIIPLTARYLMDKYRIRTLGLSC